MFKREDIEKFEKKYLAPYAMHSMDSAGRAYKEGLHPFRTSYQRDRDRIVHSEAFRKLEYKTQVFVIFEGDYYRTRLTHTLEVAQIGRTIGRNLRLNEDLIEAIALAHDVGHPPFGHAGEMTLDAILKKAGAGEFNHNKRTFEIVTKFEKRYPDFDGLNLTREVLIGILKHETQYDKIVIVNSFKEGPTLEARIVDIADSLAYLNHDIDDGLTSGYITQDDLMGSGLWQRACQKVGLLATERNLAMRKYQVVKQLIDLQVSDFLSATSARLTKLKFNSAEDVKRYKGVVAGFSPRMKKERDSLQALINTKLYHHYRVVRMTEKAKRIIENLFDAYLNQPYQLPYQVFPRGKKYSKKEKYRIIGNYIASMTDRSALEEHKKLFNPYTKV